MQTYMYDMGFILHVHHKAPTYYMYEPGEYP